MIEKVTNPQDKRSQLLSLTQEGVKIQASLAKLTGRAEQAMTEGIAEADLETFLAVSQQMLRNLDEGK